MATMFAGLREVWRFFQHDPFECTKDSSRLTWLSENRLSVTRSADGSYKVRDNQGRVIGTILCRDIRNAIDTARSYAELHKLESPNG